MTQYAIKARKQFEKDHDMERFIRTVWQHIQKNARGKHVVENATPAFLQLVYAHGRSSWIIGKDIEKKTGSYKQNRSYGLWPWLEGNDAGVIQKSGEHPNELFKVKGEFYLTLCKVVGIPACSS